MIGVKAIVLPFFEFLAPYKPGQPLYLIPERAALLCLAEVIVARDCDSGEEIPVWGTEEYERLRIGESAVRGPVLVVELSFANELEDLLGVVTAVQGANDVEDEDDEEPADDAEDDEDDEDEDDEDLEDADDDFDDEWEEVGDDDDDAEDDEEDEEEKQGDEE